MAGDWIPITVGLKNRREILAISEATSRSRHEVLGLMVDFWSWVTQETTSGFICCGTINHLVHAVGGDRQFWDSVVAVGWLGIQADGLVVPNFKRWLSKSAKARVQNMTRKRLYREQQSSA